MKRLLITLGFVAVFFIAVIPSVNEIPSLEENVSAHWSQILNQYKRRADLVPQLVKVVQGAADFEKSTLENVIQARKIVENVQATPPSGKNPEELKKFNEAQAQLGAALSRLLVVVERYPQLKATEGFLTLQSQLEGTENRIAVARRDYIQSVRDFNVKIRTFPGSLWNKLFFHKDQLPNFTESEESQKVPEIQFK
jgi:LemA protein